MLEEDRKRQDFLSRERQRANDTETRGALSMDDEAELKKVVTKGHWNLAKDKAAIHSGMEKVQTYEEAFSKIQAATGIADIEELVRQFRATAGSKRESVYYCEFVGWLAGAFPDNP